MQSRPGEVPKEQNRCASAEVHPLKKIAPSGKGGTTPALPLELATCRHHVTGLDHNGGGSRGSHLAERGIHLPQTATVKMEAVLFRVTPVWGTQLWVSLKRFIYPTITTKIITTTNPYYNCLYHHHHDHQHHHHHHQFLTPAAREEM